LIVIIHVLYVKESIPKLLEEVFYNFLLIFLFNLGGGYYSILYGSVVTGILDMRPGKHDLHFLVGVVLLPHAIVNIPNEMIHIGVLLFIFIIYFIFNIIILFL
jgi:hypothetical protein